MRPGTIAILLSICNGFFGALSPVFAASPRVIIQSPADGAVLGMGNVTITADACDSDGSIMRVDFFAGTNRLSIDFDEPYSYEWLSVPPGRYVLYAHAYDNSGHRAESSRVHIQVGDVFYERIIRGPYLQSGTSSNVVIRWRTDWATGSHVTYGYELGLWTDEVGDAVPRTDHEITLRNLLPDSVYYYAISSSQNTLAIGEEYSFRTAPEVGTGKAVRIWAIGDSGTGNLNAMAVRDSYLAYASQRAPDIWLMLGDNAYEEGTDVEYQCAVFDTYPAVLRQTVLWPTIGNHDIPVPGNPGEFPYLDIFTLPRNGEAGGLASGTEKYYSFDYANIHFVCLDSSLSLRLPGSPMLIWLENDLAATAQDWIIAYWHHPPYSKGTHDSDAEIDLVQMRENAVPLLERYGVDLVLCGHSHVYERSYLLDGHYGHSTNFTPEMILDGGFGREDEDGAYRKAAGAFGERGGAVYLVCGCSGEGGATRIRFHPAMRVSLGGFGSVVIDVDGLRLDAKFLRPDGAIEDYFTMVKELPAIGERPVLRITRKGEKAQLSWPGLADRFRLESNADTLGGKWTPTGDPIRILGRRNVVELDLDEMNRSFRLRREELP